MLISTYPKKENVWKILFYSDFEEFFVGYVSEDFKGKIYEQIEGPVPGKDMQTPYPLSFTSIFMKYAHSAESNEKSIFPNFTF